MKNFLRKASCLVLVIALVLSFAACGGKGSGANAEVEKFVEEQCGTMEEAFKESFEASSGGLTCECNTYAKGTTIVMDICIDDLNDCPDDVKEELQALYDETEPYLEEECAPLKDECEALTGVIYNICEEDGDVLATVTIDLD